MAQISNANLQAVLDDIAFWAAIANGDTLATAVTAAAAYTSSTPNAGISVANSDVLATLDTRVLTTIADETFMRVVFPAIDKLNVQNPSGAALFASVWNGQPVPGAEGVLDALDDYGQLFNALIATDRGGLDALLRVLNASTPTLRVHGLFAKYFGRVSPNNVFTDVPYVLGTILISGATAGAYTPTGLSGTGMLDTTRFAPGQVALQVTKSGGNSSADAVTMTVISGGVPVAVTFTTTDTANYLTAATGLTTKTVTGAIAQSITVTSGTNLDTFNVVILPDRAISAT